MMEHDVSLSYQHKIVDHAALMQIIAEARRDHKSIVHCHGCFDIVHPGHIRYLEYASRQGDLLLVTLTGDANVFKGDQRPYIPQELRAENLAALACVGCVYIDPNATAENILRDVKPDVYIKGREYERSEDPRFFNERAIVEENGGTIVFSSGEIVFSSSALIDIMSQDDDLQSQRLRLMCDRHTITKQSLRDLVGDFRDQRVLIVGDTILDRYIFCDALDIASEAPMMSLNKLDEASYVGGAAIVARHVAALGGQSVLLTAVGNDSNSAYVEEVLQHEGVETKLIRCRPSVAEKSRYLVDDRKLLKVQSAEPIPLDSLAQRRAVSILESEAESADAVIFCDFGFGMITAGLLERVLAKLRARVRVITADISGQNASLLNFKGADLLTPTERELRANLNDFNQGLSSVAYGMLSATQAKHLIVTLEKKGLVLFDRATDDPENPQWSARLVSEHLPTFNDRPIDSLGGGDALLATSSLALASGATVMHAAYLGNAAASLELAKLGNEPVSVDELVRWIAHRNDLPSSKLTPELVLAGV